MDWKMIDSKWTPDYRKAYKGDWIRRKAREDGMNSEKEIQEWSNEYQRKKREERKEKIPKVSKWTPEYRKAYMKERRNKEENKERAKEYQKDWRENKGGKEYQRKYREEYRKNPKNPKNQSNPRIGRIETEIEMEKELSRLSSDELVEIFEIGLEDIEIGPHPREIGDIEIRKDHMD